jgi:hypothetical protein
MLRLFPSPTTVCAFSKVVYYCTTTVVYIEYFLMLSLAHTKRAICARPSTHRVFSRPRNCLCTFPPTWRTGTKKSTLSRMVRCYRIRRHSFVTHFVVSVIMFGEMECSRRKGRLSRVWAGAGTNGTHGNADRPNLVCLTF